jgi:hypothetical protein
MQRAALMVLVRENERLLEDITPDEQQTAEAVRRIAMALLDLPREERAAQYPLIRRNFEAALTECGIEGPVADAWLHSAILGIQNLVNEIEISGGAVGGQA